MMSLETFLRRLRKAPRTWRVRASTGCLRNRRDCCPGEAIFGDDFYRGRVMAKRDRLALIAAADNYGEPHLRARLLRACGVTERTP
jgi:hypothetical protein